MTKVFNLRERPPAIQILTQMGAIVLSYFGTALVMLFIGLYAAAAITGQNFEQVMRSVEGTYNPDPTTITALKVVQFFNMLAFLVPALVLPGMLFKANAIKFTGLARSTAFPVFLLAVLAFGAFMPLLELSISLNLKMDLPSWMQGMENWMRDMEDRTGELTQNFLIMDSLQDLIFNALLMAVLPAICEEIFFRGFLQRAFYNWWGRKHLAVFLSAFVFSAIHMQFYGFLPRFLLGLLLGYLFLWSGDLKVSILVHFMNNFISLMVAWAYRDRIEEFDINAPMAAYPAFFYFISAVAGAGFLYLIYRQTRKRPSEQGEDETVYRLPVEDVPWEKIYSTSRQYEAEIVAGKLEDAGIKAVIVNKQDSSYRSFGDIEVHVPRTFYQRAKEILG